MARRCFVSSLLLSVVCCASVACANSEGSGLVVFKGDAHHDGLPLGPGDAGEPLFDTGVPSPSHDGGGTIDTGHSGGSFDSGSGGVFDTGSFGGPVDTGTSGGGPVDTGTGGPPPGGDDSTCGAMSTYADCADCCGTNHPDGYDGFITALYDCACTPSVCESTCSSTFCAATPSSPTSSCGSCLDSAQTGACSGAISSACGPGGPCAPYADCVTSQCSSLP